VWDTLLARQEFFKASSSPPLFAKVFAFCKIGFLKEIGRICVQFYLVNSNKCFTKQLAMEMMIDKYMSGHFDALQNSKSFLALFQ
tara:strand:+ start:162 stop:416 length:255 start_codon:yes stop_codon:yes gene_type:complete